MAKNDETKQTGPATTPLTGLNKRQQVTKANNMIFIWVAVSAAVIALSFVLLQFLVRQAIFNQKIISEKSTTNQIIETNIDNAKVLKQNVDKLVADQNLRSARANDSDNNLQVVLDALPTTGDTTTFSNSLYTQVVGPTGLKIESISAGITDGSQVVVETALDPTAAPVPQNLPFTIATRGNTQQTKDMFLNFEKTIRPISPRLVVMKISDGQISTTINGDTYYLSAGSVDLGKKTVQP